jgi:hypothetical protein
MCQCYDFVKYFGAKVCKTICTKKIVLRKEWKHWFWKKIAKTIAPKFWHNFLFITLTPGLDRN